MRTKFLCHMRRLAKKNVRLEEYFCRSRRCMVYRVRVRGGAGCCNEFCSYVQGHAALQSARRAWVLSHAFAEYSRLCRKVRPKFLDI